MANENPPEISKSVKEQKPQKTQSKPKAKAAPKKKAPAKAPAKTQGRRGPRAKYVEWITPQGLTLLTGWARNGLTSEQISKNIGIHPSTLCVWQNEHPEIDKAIKSGREVSDLAVENALFNKAIRGDVGAICFYLKNRRPHLWRDKPMTADELSKAEIEKARAEISLEKERLELQMLRSMAGEDTTNTFAQMLDIVDMIRNPEPDRTIDEVLEAEEKDLEEMTEGIEGPVLEELDGGDAR